MKSDTARAKDRVMTPAEWTDAEVDRILNMPEAELRAELIAQGEDPDTMARSAELAINKAIAAHLRRQGRLS